MRSLAAALLLLAPVASTTAADVLPERFEVKVLPPDFIFRFAPKVEVAGRPRIGLALSGGGARGVAHIGVLQRLDEGGYPIDSVTGVSAGALMGTLYTCGYSGKEIEALFTRVDFNRAFLDPLRRTPGRTLEEQEAENGSFLSLQVQRGLPTIALGLRGSEAMQRTLEGLLARGAYFSGGRFDDLKFPLRVVATNLETGLGRVFAYGDLVEVLRASMAVPGAFQPVVIDGQQYVDGALTENIPVFQTIGSFSPDLIMAVDVSSPMEHTRASNFFSVAARSLDLVVERRQWESKAAANLVIRPELKDVPFADYGKQLPLLVESGRRAFDAKAAAWRELMLEAFGPNVELSARRVELKPARPLPPEATRLIQDYLPEGKPLLRRHVYVVLQQLLTQGWARHAKAEVVTLGGPPTLQLELDLWPNIQRLDVDAPSAMQAEVLRELRAEFPEGERFNPTRFGAALGRWVHAQVMGGAPLIDARGSGFDPDSGVLRVKLREPRVQSVEVRQHVRMSVADTEYIRQLLVPLLGRPLRTRSLREHLDLAEQRLHLAELRYQLRPVPAPSSGDPDGVELQLVPVPHRPQSLDLSLGYETTLGGQFGLRYQAFNFGGTHAELELSGAKNRLQEQGSFALRGPFRGFPGAGLEFRTTFFEQRLDTALLFPAEELRGNSVEARIGSLDVALGGFIRFGNLGQGKASLSVAQRQTRFRNEVQDQDGLQQVGLAALEWDNFDRHGFPREGLMIRSLYGAGRTLEGPSLDRRHRFSYLRARGLQPMGAPEASIAPALDLDLEWGYGQHLPLDRWWTLGGPSFLMGSRAAGFLAPNVLVGRLGVPLRLKGAFGGTLQVVPRFDYGVVSQQASDLFRSQRGMGAGVLLRTMVARFYVELSYGWLKVYEPVRGWSGATGTFNAQIGTQPFDLWKRR